LLEAGIVADDVGMSKRCSGLGGESGTDGVMKGEKEEEALYKSWYL